METIFFVGVLGTVLLIIILLIGWPLIKPASLTTYAENDNGAGLVSDKEAILTTLNEIEFDYRMKKLAPDDYFLLRDKYKQMALDILKKEEEEFLDTAFPDFDKQLSDLKDIETEIEAEVEELGKNL